MDQTPSTSPPHPQPTPRKPICQNLAVTRSQGKVCIPDDCVNRTCLTKPKAICVADRCGCEAKFFELSKETEQYLDVTKQCIKDVKVTSFEEIKETGSTSSVHSSKPVTVSETSTTLVRPSTTTVVKKVSTLTTTTTTTASQKNKCDYWSSSAKEYLFGKSPEVIKLCAQKPVSRWDSSDLVDFMKSYPVFVEYEDIILSQHLDGESWMAFDSSSWEKLGFSRRAALRMEDEGKKLIRVQREDYLKDWYFEQSSNVNKVLAEICG